MGEQKNIGKLKQNNEKLKMEMQSLRAMLAAQAKEDASSLAHTHELDAKQKEIDDLEKRVAELEKQLATEEALVEKLEADLKLQKEHRPPATSGSHRPSATPDSPTGRKRISGQSPAHQARTSDVDAIAQLQMPGLPANYVSPEVVAKHKANISRLDNELQAERKIRREADGEIIKLRAAINGVQLNDSEVDALLAQKLDAAPKKTERYVLLLESRLCVHRCTYMLVRPPRK
jgi:hypothetical protein